MVGFDADHPFFAKAKDSQPVDHKEKRISLSSNDGYLRLAGKDLPSGSAGKWTHVQILLGVPLVISGACSNSRKS